MKLPRPTEAIMNGASGFCAISANRAFSMLENRRSTVFWR